MVVAVLRSHWFHIKECKGRASYRKIGKYQNLKAYTFGLFLYFIIAYNWTISILCCFLGPRFCYLFQKSLGYLELMFLISIATDLLWALSVRLKDLSTVFHALMNSLRKANLTFLPLLYRKNFFSVSLVLSHNSVN